MRDLQEKTPALCIGANYPREGELRTETACMMAIVAICAIFYNISMAGKYSARGRRRICHDEKDGKSQEAHQKIIS
jgi:hypothetical protein